MDMEPLFKAQHVMTEELYRAFIQAHIKANALLRFRWVPPILLMVMFCFLLVFVWLTNLWDSFLFILVFIFIGILFITIFTALQPSMMLKGTLKNAAGNLNLPVTVCFYPQEYVDYSPRGELHTPYHFLDHIVETDRVILLYQSKNLAEIIDKVGMAPGEPEQLISYLLSVRMLPYKRIK